MVMTAPVVAAAIESVRDAPGPIGGNGSSHSRGGGSITPRSRDRIAAPGDPRLRRMRESIIASRKPAFSISRFPRRLRLSGGEVPRSPIIEASARLVPGFVKEFESRRERLVLRRPARLSALHATPSMARLSCRTFCCPAPRGIRKWRRQRAERNDSATAGRTFWKGCFVEGERLRPASVASWESNLL